MTPTTAIKRDSIYHGDCLEFLRLLPDNTLDAMVTDPPAGISFMQAAWDHDKGGRRQWIAWMTEVMTECLRVLKPGAYAAVWALPRTSHWTATALEDAGFEIRDVIVHLFGSGFPKSHDVSKAIDKKVGAQRAVVGMYEYPDGKPRNTATHQTKRKGVYNDIKSDGSANNRSITAPATDAAAQWSGYGTALKPASEHWILCRKPLAEATVADQVLATGTGAINIDACRVGSPDTCASDCPVHEVNRQSRIESTRRPNGKTAIWNTAGDMPAGIGGSDNGRWPANVVISHSTDCTPDTCASDCPVREVNLQSGNRKSGGGKKSTRRQDTNAVFGKGLGYSQHDDIGGDEGGAARFYPIFWPDADPVLFRYVAKPSRKERDAGCAGLVLGMPDAHNVGSNACAVCGLRVVSSKKCECGDQRVTMKLPAPANDHPTVKSIGLMTWLVKLVCPVGGTIVEPFTGSASTLIAAQRAGVHFFASEQDGHFVAIGRERIAHHRKLSKAS